MRLQECGDFKKKRKVTLGTAGCCVVRAYEIDGQAVGVVCQGRYLAFVSNWVLAGGMFLPQVHDPGVWRVGNLRNALRKAAGRPEKNLDHSWMQI